MNRRAARAVFASVILATLLVAPAAFPQGAYNEPWRPQFHFIPAKNFMNDPNGLVFYKGEYHLFYQYNAQGAVWGHMSWGHAVSTDMLHWKNLPVAMLEQPDYMIDGEAVLTDRIYPSLSGDGIEPYSTGDGGRVLSLRVW